VVVLAVIVVAVPMVRLPDDEAEEKDMVRRLLENESAAVEDEETVEVAMVTMERLGVVVEVVVAIIVVGVVVLQMMVP
jgi:hypothetical protein